MNSARLLLGEALGRGFYGGFLGANISNVKTGPRVR